MSNAIDLARMVMDAHEILEDAIREHEPVATFLLTSGGNDSIVPLHLFRDHPGVTAAAHFDTGIKIPDVEPHVRRVCEAFRLELLVYRATENTKADGSPDPQVYEDIVNEHGFPGPAQHSAMYRRLKERQMERLIREHKTDRMDRILLVTGVRKAESRHRMGYVQEVMRRGAQVWVAPVANWTDEHMVHYRKAHGLPESAVARKLGMSGECLCGAYAKPGELAVIERHYPEVAARIRDLERGKPWGWEQEPPKEWFQYKAGQQFIGDDFMPMCVGCTKKWRTFKDTRG